MLGSSQSLSTSRLIPCMINKCFRSSTAVSLKAREVLILGQMPSYEERLVQMEAILKASVNSSVYGEQGTTNRYEVLCVGAPPC